MELSLDQKKAIEKLLKWYFEPNRRQTVTLGGYAGTGKTTLISTIKEQIYDKCKGDLKVAFCSYTGRAVQNLKVKLMNTKAFVTSKDTISTIHGLIYTPIENSEGVITGWARKDEIEADLIIVDEASMVDEVIMSDLVCYNVPIIAVGDHGQLPPIRGSFNLMQDPQLKLEEIHRQAKSNPIINLSIMARTTGSIPADVYGKNIVKYSKSDFSFNEMSEELLRNYNNDTLVLCGYNITRNKINQFIRNSLGYDSPQPQKGDRVICLRNNHKKGIYNGMLGTIIDINHKDGEIYQADIQMDDSDQKYYGDLYAPQFGATEPINFTKDRIKARDLDLFDFGYALTVHKAQGCQAKKVVLFEERFSKMDDVQWKRWLYTGVTRAEDELFMFGE
jgi:exodeoxyribonuclease-5